MNKTRRNKARKRRNFRRKGPPLGLGNMCRHDRIAAMLAASARMHVLPEYFVYIPSLDPELDARLQAAREEGIRKHRETYGGLRRAGAAYEKWVEDNW